MVETSKATGRCSALKNGVVRLCWHRCGKLNVAGLCVVRQQLWFVIFFCSVVFFTFLFVSFLCIRE